MVFHLKALGYYLGTETPVEISLTGTGEGFWIDGAAFSHLRQSRRFYYPTVLFGNESWNDQNRCIPSLEPFSSGFGEP